MFIRPTLSVKRIAVLGFICLLSFATLTLYFIPSTAAHAASSCDGTETIIIKCDSGDNGVWGILLLVMQVMSAGVGVLAVGGIVFASILWATAEDKQDQVAKAKGIITNVVIGLVAFALMWAALQFIVPGGVFNRAFGFSSVKNQTNKLPDAASNAAESPNGAAGGSGGASGGTPGATAATASCYTVTSLAGSKIEGNMFHKSGSQTYAFENSPAGLAYAASHGYTSTDLDTQVTKDGIVVNTHWSQPMKMDGFYDPQKKLSSGTKVSDMTFAQVSRLKNKDGKSTINSLEKMIGLAAEHHINLSIEVKAPVAFKKQFPKVVAALNSSKVKAYIKGHASISGMEKTFTAARTAGMWTRGTEGSQGWKKPAKCKQG